MKRTTHLARSFAKPVAHFLHSFLNACLLSFALTFLLLAMNVAVTRGATLLA
jgi:hypothetical protein